jgi:hypothetical protein
MKSHACRGGAISRAPVLVEVEELRICLVVCIGLCAATFTFSLAILTLRISHGSYNCNRSGGRIQYQL